MIVVCVSTRPVVERDGQVVDLPEAARLRLGAPYRAESAGEGWLRVWDDGGEDSLYPAAMFQTLRPD